MNIGFVTCCELYEPDPDADLLMETTKSAGIECQYVAWDDESVDYSQFDGLVIRSTWNYFEKPESFLSWLAKTEKVVPILNAPHVVRRNIDKRYLTELETAGLPVVETVFVEPSELGDVTSIVFNKAWKKFVIKPVISAGSWQTGVFDFESIAAANKLCQSIWDTRTVMIQPFLDSVFTVGERSIISIAGTPTHTIIKMPRFAGQDESVSDAQQVSSEERAMVEKALIAFGEPEALYSRLDIIQDSHGNWVISELELIEPSLFFSQCPKSLGLFVNEIKNRF